MNPNDWRVNVGKEVYNKLISLKIIPDEKVKNVILRQLEKAEKYDQMIKKFERLKLKKELENEIENERQKNDKDKIKENEIKEEVKLEHEIKEDIKEEEKEEDIKEQINLNDGDIELLID